MSRTRNIRTSGPNRTAPTWAVKRETRNDRASHRADRRADRQDARAAIIRALSDR